MSALAGISFGSKDAGDSPGRLLPHGQNPAGALRCTSGWQVPPHEWRHWNCWTTLGLRLLETSYKYHTKETTDEDHEMLSRVICDKMKARLHEYSGCSWANMLFPKHLFTACYQKQETALDWAFGQLNMASLTFSQSSEQPVYPTTSFKNQKL